MYVEYTGQYINSILVRTDVLAGYEYTVTGIGATRQVQTSDQKPRPPQKGNMLSRTFTKSHLNLSGGFTNGFLDHLMLLLCLVFEKPAMVLLGHLTGKLGHVPPGQMCSHWVTPSLGRRWKRTKFLNSWTLWWFRCRQGTQSQTGWWVFGCCGRTQPLDLVQPQTLWKRALDLQDPTWCLQLKFKIIIRTKMMEQFSIINVAFMYHDYRIRPIHFSVSASQSAIHQLRLEQAYEGPCHWGDWHS